MKATFEISASTYEHLIMRLSQRYRRDLSQSIAIINRVTAMLEQNTPVDWRFTESPSSRFFIVDETTEAKFMGLSYRDSANGRGIVQTIRDRIHDPQAIWNSLKI